MFTTIAMLFAAAARPLGSPLAGPMRRPLPFIAYPVHDLEPVLPMPVPRETAKIIRIPLNAAEAAKRFIAFMQIENKTGNRLWRDRDGLWEWYLAHCFLEDLAPLPEQVIGNALESLKSTVRDYSTGKLRRLASYTIPEVGAQTPKASPPASRKSAAKGKKRSRPGTPPAQQSLRLAKKAA